MDLVRIYRVFQRMMRYPDLLTEIRRLYLKTLVSKGITTKKRSAGTKAQAQGSRAGEGKARISARSHEQDISSYVTIGVAILLDSDTTSLSIILSGHPFAV